MPFLGNRGHSVAAQIPCRQGMRMGGRERGRESIRVSGVSGTIPETGGGKISLSDLRTRRRSETEVEKVK